MPDEAGAEHVQCAKVVTTLMVEAGLRGVSGFWLTTRRPESGSRIAKLTALRRQPLRRHDLRHLGADRAGGAPSRERASSRSARARFVPAASTDSSSNSKRLSIERQRDALPGAGPPAQIQHQPKQQIRSMRRTSRRPRPSRYCGSQSTQPAPGANDRLCASGTNSSHDSASTMTAGRRTSPAPRRHALLLILNPSNS